MNTRAMLAWVRNDIRLYLTDRRAVIVGILIPICIAAFFGYVFGGVGKQQQSGRLPVAVVDEDQSVITKAIAADLAADKMLQVTPMTREAARDAVKRGKQNAAAVFGPGFGAKGVNALFTGNDRPKVELYVDPSQQMAGRVMEGMLAQYTMKQVSSQAFNGQTGRALMDGYLRDLDAEQQTPEGKELVELPHSVKRLHALRAEGAADASSSATSGFALNLPYEVVATTMTSGNAVPYNGYAHSFAGMSVQFILFAGIDAGVMLLLLRQRGIWQRVRAAPIRKSDFMLARLLATALISAFQLTMIYLAATLIFGVRVQGSAAGLVLVGVTFCLLNAAFGLMLATLGRSPGATRGIASMVMLLLVMLGGAWVPSFIFPQWLQSASLYTPTRWAVDGLDAMTWRGLPFGDALLPAAVLVGCALICFAVATWRFGWEE